MNRPGRNDDCPCGSQKKFKKCCLPGFEQAQSLHKLSHDLVRKGLELGPHWEDFGEWNERLLAVPEGFPEGFEESWLGFFLDYGWYQSPFQDRPFAQMLLDEFGDRFSEEEARWSRSRLDSALSLFSVRQLWPGLGMILVDEIQGQQFKVYDAAASSTLKANWGILGRLGSHGDVHVLLGFYPLACPPGLFSQLVSSWKGRNPGSDPGRLLDDYLQAVEMPVL